MKRLLSLSVVVGVISVLVGCGGGGGSTSKTPTPVPSSSAASSSSATAASSESSVSSQSNSSQVANMQISGTAAIGKAIAGASVEAICADGSGFIAPVTTDAKGYYAAEIAEGALPCLLQVRNGEPPVVLHSYAFASGNVNITPLTDLVAAMYFNALPADKFAAIKANTCSDNCVLDGEQLVQAEAQLMDVLVAKGYLNGVSAFSPATTPFEIDDAFDQVLDTLQDAIDNAPDLENYQTLLQLIKEEGIDQFPVSVDGTTSSSVSSASSEASSLQSSSASSSPLTQSSSSVSTSAAASSEASAFQSSSISSSSLTQSSSSVSTSAALVEPEMVTIPAGSFQMGSNIGDFDERPVHTVSLSSFAMSKYEITFAQYDAFAVATNRELPNDYGRGRNNRPVVDVSWDDAVAYAAWLSAQTGTSYRLPSEAEWEYAARAGTTTQYSWGDGIDCNKVSYFDFGHNYNYDCGVSSTEVVGSYEPNPFGLFDMHGNVWEWTQDCWNGSYGGAPANGSAWLAGNCSTRVTRGGSWVSSPDELRSASRNYSESFSRFSYVGFRLVQVIGEEPEPFTSIEPEMITIPAGSFLMGDINDTGYSDELPVHTVTLASFAMSKYEITFVQYDAFATATDRELPHDSGWGRGNRPVINVSWDDAVAYAAWLSVQTGKSYRLPSEAEWEYAARAGTTTEYSWGDDINFCSRAMYRSCGSLTAAVGSYAPNSFGLYDMHGNVWEWTQDCVNGSYDGAPVDGSAWLTGYCGSRVLRGGAWYETPHYLRSATRLSESEPSGHHNHYGFRLVQDL